MALNYVNLTVNIFDGSGNIPQAGTATFIPTAVLTDQTNHEYIPQIPVVARFTISNPDDLNSPGVAPVVSLLATDNAAPAPSGWKWQVTFAGFTGAPPTFKFLMPFTAGANQNLSDQTPS